MNFNFLIIFTILISACGVKSRPIPPEHKKIPDYVQSHINDGKKEEPKKKNP